MSMTAIYLDAEAECARLQREVDEQSKARVKAEADAARAKEQLAEANGELRAERRTVAMLREELQTARSDHQESEKRSAQMVSDIGSALKADGGEKPSPGWRLEVLGRDGNNDLRTLRIVADKGDA